MGANVQRRAAPALRLVGGTRCAPAPRHFDDIATGLREIQRESAKGSVIGLCYVANGSDGSVRVGALGSARTDRARAHLGAARLADAMLWEE